MFVLYILCQSSRSFTQTHYHGGSETLYLLVERGVATRTDHRGNQPIVIFPVGTCAWVCVCVCVCMGGWVREWERVREWKKIRKMALLQHPANNLLWQVEQTEFMCQSTCDTEMSCWTQRGKGALTQPRDMKELFLLPHVSYRLTYKSIQIGNIN